MEEAALFIVKPQVLKMGIVRIETLWKEWKNVGDTRFSDSIIIAKYNRLRNGQFKNFNIRWTRVSHIQLGGLTDSKWLIGVSKDKLRESLLDIISSLSLDRNVTSILDESISGKICEPPLNRIKLKVWNPKAVK